MKARKSSKPKKPPADDIVVEAPFDEIVNALLRVPTKKRRKPFKKNSRFDP